MTADPYAYGSLGRAEFFSRSGIRGSAEFDQSPVGYARHLMRYITCPSTIRVRVLDRYGRAPERSEIERMQHERRDRVADVMQVMAGGEAFFGDEDDRRRVLSLLGEERRAEQRRVQFMAESAARNMAGRSLQKAQIALPAPSPAAEPERSVLSWRALAENAAQRHDMRASDIIGPRRWREIVPVRGLCSVLLKERGHTASVIGRWFNERDHSSIGYLLRRWDSHWNKRPDLRATYDALGAGHRADRAASPQGDDTCTV